MVTESFNLGFASVFYMCTYTHRDTHMYTYTHECSGLTVPKRASDLSEPRLQLDMSGPMWVVEPLASTTAACALNL